MSNKSALSTSLSLSAAPLCLIFLLSVPSAEAQTNSANYMFLVASGFLCDPPNDNRGCPAVAQSANGDTYEISGAGTFDTQKKSVNAAGTFNHKAMNGTVLETGVWLASDLVSFDSYGTAPTALFLKGPSLGLTQNSLDRPPKHQGALPTGGLAVFRIVLITVSGATRAALLQANCGLGDVPSERSTEGIRLSFVQTELEYSEELSGRVLFISKKPETSALTKP